jgi:hypothetical protein
MEVFLIIWVLFGIAASIVMGNKGRSSCGGFALGFLLGPIGLIIALVMSADEHGIERAEIEAGKMRKCPYCAELVKAEAIKCRHCGSNIHPLA